MSAAPLLCLCFVFVAAAANDCGEKGCAAEEDASVLLQSAVSSGAVQLVDEASSFLPPPSASQVQTIYNPATATSGGCSGTDESQCDRSACTWAGDSCKAHCTSYSRDSDDEGAECNDSGYCMWDGYAKGSCIEDLERMELGGDDSAVHIQAGGGSTTVVQRPELLTMQRFKTASSEWEPCSGDTDCWHGKTGSTGSWRYDSMTVTLNQGSAYSKAAVEFMVKCKSSTDSHIKVSFTDNLENPSKGDRINAGVQVWYNQIALVDNIASSSGWATNRRRNHKNKEKELEIPISSDDADPLFRMEVSTLSGSAATEFQAKIEVINVKAWFDSCMEQKQAHSQCLQVFADGNEDLRSDNAKQLACLEGTSTPDGCTAWKACLDKTPGGAETKAVLESVIKAFDQGAVQAALVQQNAITPSSWVAGVECTDGEHPECEDLSRLDIPAFSCSCYKDLAGKTPRQIQDRACPKRAMCCSWKRKNCNDASTYTLEGTVQLLEDRKKTMSNRSEQVSLAQGASLDDSLSGKRAC